MGILGALIAGAIVAVIATLIRRGGSGLPWWGTWLAGIGGAVIGYWIAAQLGVAETNGVDWIRWIISVVVAILLISLAHSLYGRGSRRSGVGI